MNSDFSLALHALVLLHRRGGVQSSEAMAQNICTNPCGCAACWPS